jgi:hypothetical protein
MDNHFNYILNGIYHKININSSIKISSDYLEEKQLLGIKFFMKIIIDLFEYLNIDYCLINKTLLGQKIFDGVHIFEDSIELLIQKNNIKKIIKEENFLNENNIYIENNSKYLLLTTYFFDYKFNCFIYLFEQNNNTIYFHINNNIIYSNFYDIYPLKKIIYEEFNVYIPNKIMNVLESCNINLNFIHLKNDKMIIKKFLNKNTYISFLIIYLVFLIYS